jgi:hypothetical protein
MESGQVEIKEYLPSKKGKKADVVMIHGKRQNGSHFQIECVPIDMADHVAKSVRGFVMGAFSNEVAELSKEK